MAHAIPEFLFSRALAHGIPKDEIPELWQQHWDHATADGREPGGRMWDKFCQAIVEELKGRRALSQADQERAEKVLRARRLARQAKAIADAAYEAQAVSLPVWLDRLRAQEADPEAEGLMPHEQALARARPPGPKEPVELWVLGALDGHGGARINECPAEHEGNACGMPVQRYVREGKVFFGWRCAEHAARP